jgi:hypothetical protein
MNNKPPLDFVYVPRVWPAVAASTFAALVLWGVAMWLGHRSTFFALSGFTFCAGILCFALAMRRRLGVIPLALPSPELRTTLIRASLGLCWGAVLFSLLLLGAWQ